MSIAKEYKVRKTLEAEQLQPYRINNTNTMRSWKQKTDASVIQHAVVTEKWADAPMI